MSERWNWDTETPWRKAFLRITPGILDDLLGRRIGLRVACLPEGESEAHALRVKVYGPDLPDKYITHPGHQIQEITWEELEAAIAPIPPP